MLGLLAIAFLTIPVLEVWVILQVEAQLDWGLTILILVLDSLVGAVLVRQEGMRAWRRFTDSLGRAELPTESIAEGALILMGGALLLTPGFVTDVVGLLAVIAPTRRLLAGVLRRRMAARVLTGTVGGPAPRGRTGPARGGPPRGRPARGGAPGAGPRDAEVIDVEVVEVRRNDAREDDRGSGSTG